MYDTINHFSSRLHQHEHQTPGAGPSRLTPHITPPRRAYLSPRTLTVHEALVKAGPDVELGERLKPDDSYFDESSLLSLGDTQLARAGTVKSNKGLVSTGGKSFFMANSTWRTNIVAFCCQVHADPVLSGAHITHIQARKSHSLPFLHEYVLVFFTISTSQRFVLRIDRLGKFGSTSAGWRQGIAPNTAIQEVGVYHVSDGQSGIDSPDGAWLAMDGRWGSEPIATLATWESEKENEDCTSHHLRTAEMHNAPIPRLKDVSRLLEAVLLEMPTYHLTTTNCYFMTRSFLLLLHRCYPNAFACHLGAMSSELVPASNLAEPVWSGLIKWYLPFVMLFLMLYIPPVVAIHAYMATSVSYGDRLGSDGSSGMLKFYNAFRTAIHAIVDAPLPIGIMHAYMTSLEDEMNNVVVRLLTQFSETHPLSQEECTAPLKPFRTWIDGPLMTFVAWCALGVFGALVIFLSLILRYALFIMFLMGLIGAVWFNLSHPNSEYELSTGMEDMFDVPNDDLEMLDGIT